MKKIIIVVIISCLVVLGCTSSKTTTQNNTSLEGLWELNEITGEKIAFDGLYPDRKPNIKFDLNNNKFSGNGSCNGYSGIVSVKGNKINFKDAKTAMTMMACQGKGEGVYLSMLNKIDSYTVLKDGKTLIFSTGKVVMMRFEKQ